VVGNGADGAGWPRRSYAGTAGRRSRSPTRSRCADARALQRVPVGSERTELGRIPERQSGQQCPRGTPPAHKMECSILVGKVPTTRSAVAELAARPGLPPLANRQCCDFEPRDRAIHHQPRGGILARNVLDREPGPCLEQIEVLRELHRLGSTMLVATTRPEDLLEICDTFAVIRDGGLIWSGDANAAAALAGPQYADAVRVRVELLEDGKRESLSSASGAMSVS
jgi:hypothetical protein